MASSSRFSEDAAVELLHRALYALPDVALAVDRDTLRILDVNRTGEAFGHGRQALANVGLDGLLDRPREELLAFVAAADGTSLLAGARTGDASLVSVSARAATAADAAAAPCVLVVLREVATVSPEHLGELRGALHAALTLIDKSLLGPTPGGPSEAWGAEKYAWLQAEIELGRDPVDQIVARYGLTAESYEALRSEWNERLQDDAQRDAHRRQLEQCLDWLRSRNQPAPQEPNAQPVHHGGTGDHAPHEQREPDMPFTKPQRSGFNRRGTVAAGNRAPSKPLPFKPPEVPDLSVEQYAALTVELAAEPEKMLDVLGLHGITSKAAWRACDAHWMAMLDADPALRKRWMQLVSAFQSKLAKPPPADGS